MILPPLATLLVFGATGYAIGANESSSNRETTSNSGSRQPASNSDQPPITTGTTSTTFTSPSAFLDTSDEIFVRQEWRRIQSLPRHKMNWTGSVQRCDEGNTSELFKQDVLERIRWYRAMAGVSTSISMDSESSRLAQAAALVMSAAGDLSHSPDSTWRCFSEDALTGASNSNLSLGDFGVESIDGYMEDPGADNIDVGHRRWLLDPFLQSIGTGDTRDTNALFLTSADEPSEPQIREKDQFVMWPPRGFVPRMTIHQRWSVSHPTANFGDAVVRVSWPGGSKNFNHPHVSDVAYGNMNSLVFEWRRPARDTGPIQVVVSGISLNGVNTQLTYVVQPFG